MALCERCLRATHNEPLADGLCKECYEEEHEYEDIVEEEEDDIDHEYTDEIVCPHCGYKFSDSWECGIGEEDLGLLTCEECDKQFYANREVSITYSTEKPTYGTCKHCNQDDVVIEDYHSSMGKYEGLCPKCGEKEKRRLREEYVKKLQGNDEHD